MSILQRIALPAYICFGSDASRPTIRQVGNELLGPFLPASGQRRFVLLAIDYFTKYVEVEALNSTTDKQVCHFL